KILALFRALDSFLVAFLLWMTLSVLQLNWQNDHTLMALFAIIIFGFFAEGNEIYYLWRGHSMGNLAYRLISAWLGTALLVLILAFFVLPVTSESFTPI